MSGDELFSDLPIQKDVRRADPGEPRMREPVRDQIELRAVDLEALVAAEHPVRVIWAYVEKLDLHELEDAIRARAHTAGQAPASPRLLLALWLYATSAGVGSARVGVALEPELRLRLPELRLLHVRRLADQHLTQKVIRDA